MVQEDMEVMRVVPTRHRHVRFDSVRDDGHRVLGVAMCVGANADRVEDLHVGMGFRPFPEGIASPAVAQKFLRKAQDAVSSSPLCMRSLRLTFR